MVLVLRLRLQERVITGLIDLLKHWLSICVKFHNGGEPMGFDEPEQLKEMESEMG